MPPGEMLIVRPQEIKSYASSTTKVFELLSPHIRKHNSARYKYD